MCWSFLTGSLRAPQEMPCQNMHTFPRYSHNSPAHQSCGQQLLPFFGKANNSMQEFTNLQKCTQSSAITSNYCGITWGASEDQNFGRMGLLCFTNLSFSVLSPVLTRLRLYLCKQRESGESCCLGLHKSCLRSFSITIHFSFKKGQKNSGVGAGQGSQRQWQCDGPAPRGVSICYH